MPNDNPRRQCLCYLFRTLDNGQRQILLGVKQRGFGVGKIMGLGGHVEPGESNPEAAAREVCEESGLHVAIADLSQRAVLTFQFPTHPEWDAVVTAYFAATWTGEIVVSDEITPAWHNVNEIPLASMWDDARYWLPRILNGERLTGEFTFNPDEATVAQAIVNPISAGHW